MCYSHCGSLVETDDTAILSIKPDPDDPASKGYACEMMYILPEGYKENFLKRKVTHPMKKINGEFHQISWSQAIDEISAQLSTIIDSGLGNKIFYMYDDSIYCEYGFRYLKELGMKHFYTIASWEKIDIPIVNNMVFSHNSVTPDYENSEVLMIVGKNAWVTQHVGPRVRSLINSFKKDPTKTLVVVDPVVTKTVEKSDLHIQLRPSTDAWFFQALLGYMYQQDLLDNEWTSRNDAQSLMESIRQIDVQQCLSVCGIDVALLDKLSRTIHKAKSFSVVTELGINHSINQIKTYTYIVLLQVLTGNFNREGGYRINNNHYLGGVFSDGTENRSPITGEPIMWGVIPSSQLSEELDFSAAFICKTIFDPISHSPNKSKVREQFKKIPFKVAFGMMWNDTITEADYILPIHETLANEVNLCPTAWHDYYKLNDRLIDPIGETKSMYEIFDLLNEKITVTKDYNVKLTEYKELYISDATTFIKELFKEPGFLQMKLARDVVGAKFNWDWLGVVWMSLIRKGYSNDSAIESLTELQNTGFTKIDKGNIDKEYKLNFNFPDDFFALDQSRLRSPGYEFTLACGFRRDKIINNVFTDGRKWVEIYVTDATRLGIEPGDLVRVTTTVGSLDLKCSVTDKTQPGYLRIPFFKEINLITDPGKVGEREFNPSYKHQFANITKL